MLEDLKQLARMKIARQSVGDSMHATRLISDLWLRLFANRSQELTWESAQHFVACVTNEMVRLLIDYGREFRSRASDCSDALKQRMRTGLQIADRFDSGWAVLAPERIEQALYIDQLLARIGRGQGQAEKAAVVQRQANIVRLRLFGCTEEETAGLLGCSLETVTKEFRKARANLARYARQETSREGQSEDRS